MDFDKYPTEQQQLNFLRPYLFTVNPETELNMELLTDKLNHITKEIKFFTLTSHLLWGFWGIIQGSQSNIEFDYIGYTMQRFQRYKDTRDLILRELFIGQ